MFFWLPLVTLFMLFAARAHGCTGQILSLDDVSAAVKCKIVNIYSFTVPAGETFSLDLLPRTVVEVKGDVQFGNKTWGGPLFELRGEDIHFRGNGHTWDGGGPFYWDGLGDAPTSKPVFMISLDMSGVFTSLHIVNYPSHGFSVFSNRGSVTVSGVTVDNRQGDHPNSKSNGLPAAHNTDGFNLAGDNITIQRCRIYNQDDCIAIYNGTNILLKDNYCSGSNGISIGPINDGRIVNNVTVTGNNVTRSLQAFRIHSFRTATSGSVSNVFYQDNHADKLKDFGVIVSQSWPDKYGTPGNGVKFSNINFSGGTTNVVAAKTAYYAVGVNCAEGSCTDQWDWSGLVASGGKGFKLTNGDCIQGLHQ